MRLHMRTAAVFCAVVLLVGCIEARAEEKFASPFDLFLQRDSYRPLISPSQNLEYGSQKKGKNSRVMVNGCSKNASFMTFYGMPPGSPGKKKKPPRCDAKLAMHSGLARFIDDNLATCLDQAASNALGYGKLSTQLRGTGNRIFHHGCIGDSRHQKTGSWHNEGLALDVTGFQIGDTILRYQDALKNDAEGRRAAQFFIHFRRCWGQKVANFSSSCRQTGRSGQPAGTIGNEDKRHKHHLHISLPCKSLSNGRSTYTADIWQWLMPEAVAQADGPEELPPIVSQVEVATGSFTMKAEDTGGEPIHAGLLISVSENCGKGGRSVTHVAELEACAYDGFRKVGHRAVELLYRTSKLVDGVLSCSETNKAVFKATCSDLNP